MEMGEAMLWMAVIIVGNTVIGAVFDAERLASHRAAVTKAEERRAQNDHEFWAVQINSGLKRIEAAIGGRGDA